MPDPAARAPKTSPEERARRLLDLGRRIGAQGADLHVSLHRITEAAADVLGVERVGVWFFDAERTRIRCADHYEREADAHGSGAELERDHFPAYFSALESERALAAEDARRDPRTRELAPVYLEPAGIGALLDAPIWHGGALVGVICHEHVGGVRPWSLGDRSFAASMADFVALALAEQQRSQAESALRKRDAQFRLITEHAHDMIVELDSRARFRFASPNVREILGYDPESLLGTDVFANVHPEDAPAVAASFRRAVEALGTSTVVFRYRLRDGTWRWFEAKGRAFRSQDGDVRGVVISRDVTERREAEQTAGALQAQLSQAQRLEALGRLAGGIAHDFNNLLTAVLGHLDVAEEQLPDDHPARAELRGATEVALRAADLTRQLVFLGRSQSIEPRVLDPNAEIEGLLKLIRRVIGEDVALEVDLDPEAPAVFLDRSQVSQILMNLAVNCRDAMPHGGRLSVSTCRVVLGEEFVREHLGRGAGVHVRLQVRDTGVGMDEPTRSRVFDPFFTTKDPGRGVGLGLSTTYGIVRQAGGMIAVESRPGAGTTVTVWLPEATEQEREQARAPVPAVPRTLAGHERILVVEDEEAVRRLVERALGAQGYDVLTATNGREALERLEGLEGAVDLVVSDVVMPSLGGVELARILAQRHPAVKVLLVSGYAPPAGKDDGPSPGAAGQILKKPFTTRQLLERVRSLLEKAPAPARPGGAGRGG